MENGKWTIDNGQCEFQHYKLRPAFFGFTYFILYYDSHFFQSELISKIQNQKSIINCQFAEWSNKLSLHSQNLKIQL
jgi:hypothetical protein